MSKIRASEQVDASGTPSSTTYLRGDDTWATPPGGSGGVTFTDAVSTSDMASVPVGSWGDVPGLSITLTAAGTGDVFAVAATVDFNPGGVVIASLSVDSGTPSTVAATCRATAGGCVSQTWRVTGLSAGSHTFKIQAQAFSGSPGTAHDNSTMGIWQFS